MKKEYLILGLLLFFISRIASAQYQKKQISLVEAITIAKKQSIDILQAKKNYQNSYWQYQSFKANFLPSVSIEATVPSFTRSISKISLPDGSYKFVEQKYALSNLGFSVTQNLALTGGQFFFNSDIQRLDLFQHNNSTSWASNPLTIGIRQPLFKYNQFKSQYKIEPLKYAEAERQFVAACEQVSITTINCYFDVLTTQVQLNIQQTNLANNDTLYNIAKERYLLATISKSDLLQIELQLLNARSQVQNMKLELKKKMFTFKSFLRLKDTTSIELVPPTEILNFEIDPNEAIQKAILNRTELLTFKRRLLEAESNLSETKANNRFSANLTAIYGTTQSAYNLRGAYSNLNDMQQLMLGVQIPILDWGQRKGKVKLAEANLSLEKISIQQDLENLEQDVYIKALEFNTQKNQMEITAKADTISQERYQITKQRFIMGKIGITELNIAQSEKVNAGKEYINSLYSYWLNYYQVRKYTLFDFVKRDNITVNKIDLLAY